MAKFNKPQVPAGATDDERRAIYFSALSSYDVNDQTEEKNGLKYLSWASAWRCFKDCIPSATYSLTKNEKGFPFFSSPSMQAIFFLFASTLRFIVGSLQRMSSGVSFTFP